MKSWTILKVALRALTRNRLRSALTLLGMIIGVGAVIAMVSLGQGAQKLVEDQIQSVGSNLLYISPGTKNTSGAQTGSGGTPTLTADDMYAILSEVPAVSAATPIVDASNKQQIVFGGQNWLTRIEGTSDQAPEIRNYKMLQGEYFDDGDVRGAERVVVLGKTVADKVFLGVDPIGQIVRLKNLPFRVVGVLAPKGQSSTGQDQDDIALCPYTTVQKKIRKSKVIYIDMGMVTARSPLAARIAETQITDLLRQRHKLRPGDPDDFQVRNLTDVAEAAEQTTFILTLFLGSIGAVSLIVGGIGIMNIMLVSVTERTREIGIRMAIGAHGGHIRLQFLSESVLLSLTGGIVGILLGAAASVSIARFLSWPTRISPLAVIVSFAFSAAVGVFFGYYPAHRAASLDPIEALRYE